MHYSLFWRIIMRLMVVCCSSVTLEHSWSWNGDGIRGHLYSVFPAGTNSLTTNQLLNQNPFSCLVF